jgi:hypothetical protein
MYHVKNIALRSYEAKGFNPNSPWDGDDEGKQALMDLAAEKGIGLPTRNDETTGFEDEVDWYELQRWLMAMSTLNWVAKTGVNISFTNPRTKERTIKTKDSTNFFELYASQNLGLANLKPGQTQDIREDKAIFEQLTTSAVNDKIEITNDKGEVIFTPVYQDSSYEDTQINHKGEFVKVPVKFKRIVNGAKPITTK